MKPATLVIVEPIARDVPVSLRNLGRRSAREARKRVRRAAVGCQLAGAKSLDPLESVRINALERRYSDIRGWCSGRSTS
jgi:hypothetical protein